MFKGVCALHTHAVHPRARLVYLQTACVWSLPLDCFFLPQMVEVSLLLAECMKHGLCTIAFCKVRVTVQRGPSRDHSSLPP